MKANITNMGVPDSVRADAIDYAPWNPRPEITEDDVRELAASIKDNGLLNRISLVANPDNNARYIVFAGNRRLAAFRLAYGDAGLIPCEVFDISIADAKVLTALENLQRKDVEPLREAALVEECLDGGMTGEEIAAKVGKSAAWVTRRRKLIGLEPMIREAAEQNVGRITTDALENIAIYPPPIQKALAKDVINRMNYGRVEWREISHVFKKKTQLLDGENFVERAVGECDCKACPNRTGAQADLFGDVAEGKLGCCLDDKCFKRHEAEWQKAMIDAAVPPSVKEREIVKYVWLIPDEAKGKKPTKARPCAYVYIDYSGNVSVSYGPTREELAARRDRKENAQKEAEEARRKSEARAKRVLDKIADGMTGEELGRLLKEADRNLIDWDFVGEAVLSKFDDVVAHVRRDVATAVKALPPSVLKYLELEDEVVWVLSEYCADVDKGDES